MSDNIHHKTIFKKPQSAPLPYLLADSIRQAIQEERLKPGEQLPSEPKFARQLGISRTTLRDAVTLLIGEGALERRHGVGTFVANNPLINIQEGLETLAGTSEVIRQQGYKPGTSRSSSENLSAPEYLAEVLNLPPEAPLLHLSRTRTANGVPVIQCEEYLPANILPPELLKKQKGDWSLYQLLKDAGLSIASAVSRVVPVAADQRLAGMLKVARHDPLLLLRQTHYTPDRQPVLYCENYHNCSVIEFHVIRRPQR